MVVLGTLAIILNTTFALAGFHLHKLLYRRDVWRALAENYRLHYAHHHKAVQHQIDWFTNTARNRAYVESLSVNAKPYLYYVYHQVAKRHMPAEIALIPMIESNYRPYKYSPSGATGMWQLMPGTASGLGLRINWWYDGRRDIIESTQAALQHFAVLHNIFHNWLLAIAAYNCGSGTVLAAIHHNKKRGLPTDFWSLPLPRQTKAYVPRLLALAKIFKNPAKYHIQIEDIPNEPFFTAVPVNRQLTIKEIARLADAPDPVIRNLNPGFRRWATDPTEDYLLLLPVANADIFKVNLASLKEPMNWIHYRVKRGESLSEIAWHNHTTIYTLKRLNQLTSNELHPGQVLLLPNNVHDDFIRLVERDQGSISEDRIPGPKRIIHVVNANETLDSIAHRYKVTPNQIRYWNEINYHSQPKPDQKLVIWQ